MCEPVLLHLTLQGVCLLNLAISVDDITII
jgi:hypothetical protein